MLESTFRSRVAWKTMFSRLMLFDGLRELSGWAHGPRR